MDQKHILSRTLSLIKRQQRHRWWLRAVTGMAAVVVFATTYLLILPAITMENSVLEVTATPSETILGETIYSEIYAEAKEERYETIFLLTADGDNAGLDDRGLAFDDRDVALLEDEDGQEIRLHREYGEDGRANYWFALKYGQSSRFSLPWINGVDRYRAVPADELDKMEEEGENLISSDPEEVRTPGGEREDGRFPGTENPGEGTAEDALATGSDLAAAEGGIGSGGRNGLRQGKPAGFLSGQRAAETAAASEKATESDWSAGTSSDGSRKDGLATGSEWEDDEEEEIPEESLISMEIVLDQEGDPQWQGSLTLSFGSGATLKKAMRAAEKEDGISMGWSQQEGVSDLLTFTARVGNVTVTAQAEHGVLPEGTALQVIPLEGEEPMEIAEEWSRGVAPEDAVLSAHFYDISFVNEAGQPLEPEGEVSVTMAFQTPVSGNSDLGTKQGENGGTWKLAHISETWGLENLTDADTTKIWTNQENAVERVNFQSDEFSVYALLEVQQSIKVDGIQYIPVPQASVTVNESSSSISGTVGETLQVEILFELGSTGVGRNYFYYKLPEGIEVPSENGELKDQNGKTLGTYSYKEVNGTPYLLLNITTSSTSMSGYVSFGASFQKEGTYSFEGGPAVTILPEDIEKNKLTLKKTAGDAVENLDGSWSWTFTISVENSGNTPVSGIVLRDQMTVSDKGYRVELSEVTASDGAPPFGTATETENTITAQISSMTVPRNTTYEYIYTATLSKEDAEKAQKAGISLSYENTAGLLTEEGTPIRYTSAQIAYVTAADIFQKNGALPDDEDSNMEWTVALSTMGKYDAAGSPIRDELNKEAYDAGKLCYIAENTGPYQPYVSIYANGISQEKEYLTWEKVDSLEDVSELTDEYTLYYCENEFYWPGMSEGAQLGVNYGFELHYWTNYPKDFSQYGENMNQAQSNFKGIPIGVSGESHRVETNLNKELTELRNDMTADWTVTLQNFSGERQKSAFIGDELPNEGESIKDTMEKLGTFPDSHPALHDEEGNYFWVFDSVKKLEEVTGIQISVRDENGRVLKAEDVLLRSPDPDGTPAYIGFGYYEWGAWRIYPNLYGKSEFGKRSLKEAAAGDYDEPGCWYDSGNVLNHLSLLVRGDADSYLPSSGTPTSDFSNQEGYTIELKYTTNCAQDPSVLQARRTNRAYYGGVLGDGTPVQLSAEAAYYMTASQEVQPVQKSLADTAFQEDGSITLTYLALLDNRYRSALTTDEWVDQISGVDGAEYIKDSLEIYRAKVKWDDGSKRWNLERVNSVSQLEENQQVSWNPGKYPEFLQVEQDEEGFKLTLDYKDVNETQLSDFLNYVADFKDPDTPSGDPGDWVKASFYLAYKIQIPADTVEKLEKDAVLRNTISAYADREFMGSSHAEYALDAKALSKTLTEPPMAENEYTAAFQLNIQMTEELKELSQFSVVDVLSDTLGLDVTSIQVAGVDGEGKEQTLTEGYRIYVDGQTLTLLFTRGEDEWLYDRYRVTYDAKINGISGDKVSYKNTAVIPEISGTPQVVEDSVAIADAGAVVKQARVEVYKYDGDDAKQPLAGAEFVLVPLKEEKQSEVLEYLKEWEAEISQEDFDQMLKELSEKSEVWDDRYAFEGRTGEDGTLTFQGGAGGEDTAVLANRIYLLKETESPNGYLLSKEGYSAFFLIYQGIGDSNGDVKRYLAPYIPNKGMEIQYQVPNYKAHFSVYKVSAYDEEEYLTGAEFTLYEDSSCTKEVGKGILTQDENGIWRYYFGDLSTSRSYYLKETKAPDGFILEENLYEVEIAETGEITFYKNDKRVDGDGGGLTVENMPAIVLPESGGSGKAPFAAGGLAFMALAGLMYISLRRKGGEAP